jgi:hypothetical protein
MGHMEITIQIVTSDGTIIADASNSVQINSSSSEPELPYYYDLESTVPPHYELHYIQYDSPQPVVNTIPVIYKERST